MNEREFGARVRELRLKRGLTQKELAGDHITRNMLSLIESGNASPSVQTLLWLAERLDAPVGYFFSDAESECRYLKLSVIDALKEAYRAKDASLCVELCAGLPPPSIDDEVARILAEAHFSLAKERAARFAIRSANRELDEAERFAGQSVYCREDFSAAVRYLRELCEASSTASVPAALCDPSAASAFVPYWTIAYFRALAGHDPKEEFPKGSHYDRHLNARALLRGERQNEGIKKLRELSLDAALPFYMQYRVLCDLEDAANAAGDLRLAYSSSRRKIELIDKMKF
ncbi:MAG: helix-turn-helix domain-containing protein [Clostridia bacterium]|nr:helix-turn-helix domain-containing protein [Clostridia bacterium]